jgi:peroxiredoxin Q/BCP
MPLNVGDPAPAVTLHLQDGRSLPLADLRGERAVVIFFYPKDNTPVCTAEACSSRYAGPSGCQRRSAFFPGEPPT